MGRTSAAADQSPEAGDSGRNVVELVGRVAADPEERTLPSGDLLWTFRLVVPRAAGAVRTGPSGRRCTVDALECLVWDGRLRRSVLAWQQGDVVRVEGALRRRFHRSPAGPRSRVEVEVTRARRLRRRPGPA
jgi:single-strand DNA-binding protein